LLDDPIVALMGSMAQVVSEESWGRREGAGRLLAD